MDRSQLTKQPFPLEATDSRRRRRKKKSARSVCRVGGRRGEEAKTKGPEGWETQRHRNTVCEASECQPGLLLTWRDRSQLPTPPALR
ncbi:hypothetical protein CLIM01_12561 [Colletotrichum limetticola]|uniref:Uncharacterized protein n=1 Tax=Colletotrichum limetticola TaxID=1209924 RepID=A0ABQ9PDU8_9PEZI|nr:hypothetical protein CLIM01_12561 [Colletotrichum limetticola]